MERSFLLPYISRFYYLSEYHTYTTHQKILARLLPIHWQITNVSLKKILTMSMFLLGFAVCLLSGVICFGIFYKCIDWFEKI